MKLTFYIFSLLLIIIVSSCKRDTFSTNENLKVTFNQDTVFFDTLFTTFGSSTHQLKIFNPSNDIIQINRIQLAGGANSSFRINVDGISSDLVENLEIRANDSAFIFIELTVEQINLNDPFIIQDSILFEVNNPDAIQDIDLIAWGQDAHYYSGSLGNNILTNDTTWTNDKPHVVFGQLWVDSAATLTIEEGTSIHIHNTGIFGVYKEGTLLVNGSLDNPVTFQGTRLDDDYKEIPGQWDRIYIHRLSYGNIFNYTTIKNASIGIQIDQFPSETTLYTQQSSKNLTLNNCQIRNMTNIGVFGIAAHVEGNNLMVSNCGQYLFTMAWGGEYNLKHCTFANHWNTNFRESPSVVINDIHPYYNISDVPANTLTSAYIGNSIIFGTEPGELSHSFSNPDNLNITYENVIAKVDTSFHIDDGGIYNSFLSEEEDLQNIFIDNGPEYYLNENSPAINVGSASITSSNIILLNDLDGILRDGSPDLGALEYQP